MKKYLPTKDRIREISSLKFLGGVIFEPNLWHFNRYSVSYAAFIGIFCCFLPIPFQMIPCLLLVILVRCNVPVAIAFVWISNPLTMAPIMYFSYRVGTWILGQPNTVKEINLSLEWLTAQMAVIWQPLLLGSLTSGVVFGLLGFVVIRVYWRWKVAKHWSIRKLRNKLKIKHH